MYLLTLVVLLALGAYLAVRGAAGRLPGLMVAGVATMALTLAFFAMLSLWGEYLWYQNLGFARRFLVQVAAIALSALAGAVLVSALVAVVTLPVRRVSRWVRWLGIAVGGLLGGILGGLAWGQVLRWLYRVDTGVRDPILGQDTGFYLFSVPLWDVVYAAAMLGVWLSVGVMALSGVDRRDLLQQDLQQDRDRALPYTRGVYASLGALALVFALGQVLSIFHLLNAYHGVFHGPGWTDVHVRIPGHLATSVALALAGVILVFPPTSRALERRVERGTGLRPTRIVAFTALSPLLVAGAVWALGVGILPGLFQWLKVTPNELALERPYIEHAIAFTRRAFALDRVEERPFPLGGVLTPQLLEDKDHLLREVRLWDPRALDQVLEQFQEIRLYYEIAEIDIDRYTMDGRYRQVMIAPREMETANLPPESRTFVNQHFKYTHGYGLAMAPVSDFTPDGLPRLLVRDLPPASEHETLQVSRPEIYFGELTDDYVVVNSEAAEFDYPRGNENVYVHYAGTGGVEMGGMWRKVVYGWKVGGTKLLFSTYPREGSRIMFRRNVVERVATVAPFLRLDHDPYLVLVDGRLKWILDAYTVSNRFPYSEPARTEEDPRGVAQAPVPYRAPPEGWGPTSLDLLGLGLRSELAGVNYVRNSVKAVVDAYDGAVRLYVFEPDDPIVAVWSRAFPELFQPAAAMPEALRAHVRYPEGFLRTQGQMYAKYHMIDPVVFYNQEDLWVHATEKHYGDIRIVDPYYVMWQPPGQQRAEFILMQPFTPKQRQVLIGWIAGMCDGDNYGRLLAYSFPKDQWVLGPQQVDTKIDQDPQLSGQLTLWDQLGKRVIRGNVLAIPLGDALLYVEPIYLQAESAAYPELRMVVAMHGDDMAYAPTFDAALDRLVRGRPEAGLEGRELVGAIPPEVLQQARDAFEAYVRLMGQGRFEEAAGELRALGEELEAGPAESPRTQ